MVGTFGGINIPPVTIFMDGFHRGVDYYNKAEGAEVKVLGWDPAKKEGLFTNNFESLDDGRAFAKNLADEGADIVMPVAGPVGLGSAALAAEIGVRCAQDHRRRRRPVRSPIPTMAGVYLTSVEKKMDATVLEAIKAAIDGTFKGGVIVGTLANGGVDLAPFHDMDAAVPAELKGELEAIRKGIIDGSINVKGGG